MFPIPLLITVSQLKSLVEACFLPAISEIASATSLHRDLGNSLCTHSKI